MASITNQLLRLRDFRRSKTGVMAVEIALTMPILMLMIVAVVDVGMAIQRKMTMEQAAKVGTQYAMLRKPVQGDVTNIRTATKNALPASWFEAGTSQPTTVTPALSCECPSLGVVTCSTTCPAGEQRTTLLTISVTKVHKPLFNYPLMADTMNLLATASVRLQ
jgi:Flp pilus assembly protein TadG